MDENELPNSPETLEQLQSELRALEKQEQQFSESIQNSFKNCYEDDYNKHITIDAILQKWKDTKDEYSRVQNEIKDIQIRIASSSNQLQILEKQLQHDQQEIKRLAKLEREEELGKFNAFPSEI